MSVISKLDVQVVSVPIRRAIIGPVVSIERIDNVVTRLETQDRLVGWSYIFLPDPSRAAVVKSVVEDLSSQAIGWEPSRYQRIYANMWNRANFLGHRGATLFGMSAIDMAVWDLHCKVLGQPLHKVLGSHTAEVPCYSSELLEADSSCKDDELAAEARRLAKDGFTGIKMRVGLRPVAEEVGRVGAVRDAIGPHVDLMVDAAQRLTMAQSNRLIRALAEFDLAWFEDPVPQEQVDDMAAIRRTSPIPIASGHNDYGRYGFRALIEKSAVDVMLFDIARVGGITEFLRVAGHAAAYDVPMSSHVYPDISVQLVASIPNGLSAEHQEGWQPPNRSSVRPVNSTMRPSDAPGIGLDFDLQDPVFAKFSSTATP